MKTRKALFLSFAFIVFCLALFSGCSSKSSFTTLQASVYSMDTEATLVISDDFDDEDNTDRLNELWTEIKSTLVDVENSLSAGITGSSVDVFNAAEAGDTVEIDKMCYDVLSLSLELYDQTDGYFNPGIYYCSDLYGFAVRTDNSIQPYDRVEYVRDSDGNMVYDEDGNPETQITYDVLPDVKYVEAFKELSGHFDDITLYSENGRYYATKPSDAYVEIDGTTYSLKMDLGGIGKGYATDLVNNLIGYYGFEYGYFTFGSSSIATKKCASAKDEKWNLEFRNPRGNYGSGYISVSIADSFVSTSGDYEQYYILDGVRYCHIIDPATGSPIQTGIITATIVGNDPDGLSDTRFDAYSTALLAMGLEKAVDFINMNLTDYICAFVYESAEGQCYIITNSLDEVVIKNGSYKIGNTLDDDGNIVLTF